MNGVLFFIFVVTCSVSSAFAVDEPQMPATGLVEIADFKYPVFLYVPESMMPGERYPMVMSFPDQNETASEHIQKWMVTAKHITAFILVPSYLEPRDVPASVDDWVFEIKHLVTETYPVNAHQVFLMGHGQSSMYASYLAIEYPEEFAAAAFVGGELLSYLEKVVSLKDNPARQIPMQMVMKQSQPDLLQRNEQVALRLQEKAYPIEIEQVGLDADLTRRDFRKDLIQQLAEKSEDWILIVEESDKTFKQKFKKAAKEFFTV